MWGIGVLPNVIMVFRILQHSILLERLIRLLASAVEEEQDHDINERLLHQIIITEGSRAYLTRQVGEDKKAVGHPASDQRNQGKFDSDCNGWYIFTSFWSIFIKLLFRRLISLPMKRPIFLSTLELSATSAETEMWKSHRESGCRLLCRRPSGQVHGGGPGNGPERTLWLP